LVGVPVSAWLISQGARVSVLTEKNSDLKPYTLNADIIISGAGAPGLIKLDMIKERVILIDVGTSEQAGKFVGDIDPDCEPKASLYAPVPGGVGPITVAMLFRNLVELSK
jgi:methylenetetrahydrofolate dehydrogenase (NADP+)/methenyltetrahydrofolate cyclohydrolase